MRARNRLFLVVSLLLVAGLTAVTATAHTQRPNGTLRGELELCGGPMIPATDCNVMTGRWTACVDRACMRLNEILVSTPGGRVDARVLIRRGRFTTQLRPGRYTVALLWTSKHRRPQVARTWHVPVRAGRTTSIVFKGYAA